MKSIEIKKDGFYIHDNKTKIVSGAMHYFRMFPEYWENRLLSLKELGANCVETYSAWNLHEKEEGKWDFSDRLDLVKYIQTAKKLGLYVILRPGPYICSECDMGGLPWWLLKYDDIKLRAFNSRFLEKAKIYLEKICTLIKPHLITNGGNVILVQVENEFGAYGDDKPYLMAIRDILLNSGIDVPLVTCDWEADKTLNNGTLGDVYATVNYRSASEYAIGRLKAFRPNAPGGVMELWNGKAIHLNKKCEKRNLIEVEDSVKKALEYAELLNLYMFHGGTNFGFFNGATYDGGKFYVQATSYDVQAPLGEYGNKTDKYYIEQKVICDYLGKDIVNNAPVPQLKNYGSAEFICQTSISNIDKKYFTSFKSDTVMPMEKYGQAHGCIAYTATFESNGDFITIKLPIVHDFASVYVDNDLVGRVERDGDNLIGVQLDNGTHSLTVFVEEMGRVNFGEEIFDPKGLIGDIEIICGEDSKVLKDFTVTCYSFDEIDFVGGELKLQSPALYKYKIELNLCFDTYLEIKGFTRGFVFVNGFNLGRYWSVGPQGSLYLPKRLLKDGINQIIVFDSCATEEKKSVILSGKQILDGYTD